jgi:hypothetical protein
MSSTNFASLSVYMLFELGDAQGAYTQVVADMVRP